MAAIGAATSNASDLSTLLQAGSADPEAPTSTSAPAAPDTADGSAPRDPATRVDLSDKVKDILARASTDKDVADRLKAFVESHRNGDKQDSSDSTTTATSSSTQSRTTEVSIGFEQLSGGTPADDESDGPVQVQKNFATGLKADGYTISAIGRASDGSFQVEIMGPDGKSFLDRRFGTTGEFSSFSGITAGGAAQSYQRGNKEYITFAQSDSASVSVAASSDAGSIAATSTGTHTKSTTFVVDFSTGAISMLESESLSVSTTAQASQPGSSFSALA
jgi:hypothetical protein